MVFVLTLLLLFVTIRTTQTGMIMRRAENGALQGSGEDEADGGDGTPPAGSSEPRPGAAGGSGGEGAAAVVGVARRPGMLRRILTMPTVADGLFDEPEPRPERPHPAAPSGDTLEARRARLRASKSMAASRAASSALHRRYSSGRRALPGCSSLSPSPMAAAAAAAVEEGQARHRALNATSSKLSVVSEGLSPERKSSGESTVADDTQVHFADACVACWP